MSGGRVFAIAATAFSVTSLTLMWTGTASWLIRDYCASLGIACGVIALLRTRSPR